MDVARLVELNAAYARAIDNEQFEEWPKLFHDPCLYKVTTAENVAQGLEGGLIYADTRGMLEDRIASLRSDDNIGLIDSVRPLSRTESPPACRNDGRRTPRYARQSAVRPLRRASPCRGSSRWRTRPSCPRA